MTSRFEIRIFLYGRLAYVYQFDDYAEARKTYLRETGHFEQYTQLVVEGEIYNTAKAERFFGPRSTQEKWELLAPLRAGKTRNRCGIDRSLPQAGRKAPTQPAETCTESAAPQTIPPLKKGE